METAQICRKSGKLAAAGVCSADPRGSAVYTEYFAKGTVPTEVCDKHVAVTVCAESGGRATEFCPNKTSRVCMVLPEGETGTTDDSYFAIPGTCPLHTNASSIIIQPSTGGAEGPSGGSGPGVTVQPVGPAYQTNRPTVEERGPGAGR